MAAVRTLLVGESRTGGSTTAPRSAVPHVLAPEEGDPMHRNDFRPAVLPAGVS